MGALISAILGYLPAAVVSAVIGTVLYELLLSLFDPKGMPKVGQFIANWFGGAISIASDVLAFGEKFLAPVARDFLNAATADGGGIFDIFHDPAAAVARKAFTEQNEALKALGASNPDNAVAGAANAMGTAFGFGLASHGVAAAFEALFPEKLNCFNAIGPMLAEMAGFKEVAGNVLDALYENAFGKSLEYHYRSEFRPELPDEADAVNWHSKRLLDDKALRRLFEFSGLKREYEEAFVAAAYRTVQPRALTMLFEDQEFPRAEVKNILEFSGIREQDISTLLDAYEWNSTRNVRHQYLAALIAAVEQSTIDDQTLDSHLDTLHFSAQAKNYVRTTVALKRLDQLAQLYRRSVTILYETGQLTDAQYVPALEAIGINTAYADAYYAVDSARLKGKVLAREEREAEKEAARLQRERIAGLHTLYMQGGIDSVAAAAGLAELGLPPPLFQALIAHWGAELEARKVDVFGVHATHVQAILLRERVAATKEQFVKKLLTVASAREALKQYGIPEANIEALISAWSAQVLKQVLPP